MSNNLTKKELAKMISLESDISIADAIEAINFIASRILRVMDGDNLTIRNFGSFRPFRKVAGVCRGNPYPSCLTVKFVPSKTLDKHIGANIEMSKELAIHLDVTDVLAKAISVHYFDCIRKAVLGGRKCVDRNNFKFTPKKTRKTVKKQSEPSIKFSVSKNARRK